MSTSTAITLHEGTKDDLMFQEVPEGVYAFKCHWIQSILTLYQPSPITSVQYCDENVTIFYVPGLEGHVEGSQEDGL